jgi:hypothetical protein
MSTRYLGNGGSSKQHETVGRAVLSIWFGGRINAMWRRVRKDTDKIWSWDQRGARYQDELVY